MALLENRKSEELLLFKKNFQTRIDLLETITYDGKIIMYVHCYVHNTYMSLR